MPLRTSLTVVLAIVAGVVLSMCAAPEEATAGLSPNLDLRASLETTMPTIRMFLDQLFSLFGSIGPAGDELHRLDDAALADIGIDRSEITSIDAEAHGHAALTRRRVTIEI